MNTAETILAGRSFEPLSIGAPVLMVTCPVIALEILRARFTPKQNEVFFGTFLQNMSGFTLNEHQGVLTGTVSIAGDERSPVGLLKLEASEGEIVFETASALERVYAPLMKANEDALPADRQRAYMSRTQNAGAMLLNDWGDADKLEQDHPWIRYVNLSEMERAQLTATADKIGFMSLLCMADPVEECSDQPFGEGKRTSLDEQLGFGDDEEKNDAISDELYMQLNAPSTEKRYLVLPDTAENRALVEQIWNDSLSRLEKDFVSQAESLENAKNHPCF